jgi:hypothetical protein
MNNGDPWWYRTLAHSSPSVFWCLWGVVVGACLGVFAAAADIRGDVLRVYLAVVTAIGGGLLGIYGSRAADRFNDQRRIRRKAHIVRMKIRELRINYMVLHDQIRAATNDGTTVVTPTGDGLTDDDAIRILVAASGVYLAATSKPDFDDIVDSDEDFIRATQASRAFSFAADFYQNKKIDADDMAQSRLMAGVLIQGTAKESASNQLQILENVERHFAQFVRRDAHQGRG